MLNQTLGKTLDEVTIKPRRKFATLLEQQGLSLIDNHSINRLYKIISSAVNTIRWLIVWAIVVNKLP